MSFQVVNGYVCFNCADVALAKKDINPAHPPGSLSSPTGSASQGPNASSTTSGSQTSAVVFGGALAQTGAATTQPGSSGPAPYQPGSTLSLSA